jgi:hypothetical protein
MSAGAPARLDPEATAMPGRSVISSRAYEQLIRAVAGEALGVGRRESAVRVSDAGGRLAIAITGPAGGDGQPVVELVESARATITERTVALTGAAVGEVSIHITDIRFREGRTR